MEALNNENEEITDTKTIKIKILSVDEPEWVGDSVTGHRTYHVICECNGDH